MVQAIFKQFLLESGQREADGNMAARILARG
jgi:hypothetical protein